MKLGSQTIISGQRVECVGFTAAGKPRFRGLDGKFFSNGTSYAVGDVVRIVGLMPGQQFDGEIYEVDPQPLARVTTRDPVWFGADGITRTNFRKVKA